MRNLILELEKHAIPIIILIWVVGNDRIVEAALTRANFTEAFEAHAIKRIERYEPTPELPYVWYAVELQPDSRCIGTGKTVAEAFAAAGQLRQRLTESQAA